jgi:hypothetical protein
VNALSFPGRRRKEWSFDSPSDDGRNVDGSVARPLIECDNLLGELTCRRAEVQAPFGDFFVFEQFLRGERVQDGLQRGSALDDHLAYPSIPSGLVIDNPEQPTWMALNEIDRAAKLDAAVQLNSVRHRSKVCFAPIDIPRQAE